MHLLGTLLLLSHLGPGATGPGQIVNLYDAFGEGPQGSKHDWGYAALVEHDGRRILFDTGNRQETFVGNLRVSGHNLAELDAIVISHAHGDHTAGLRWAAAQAPEATVYVPVADLLPPADDPSRSRYVVVDKDRELWPGVRLLAAVRDRPPRSRLPEISLMLDTSRGSVVVIGCGHPGLVRILRKAKKHGPVHLATGGFHLLELQRPKLRRISRILVDEIGLDAVRPSHCTGKAAHSVFREELEKRGVGRASAGGSPSYRPAGLGSVIVLPPP